MVWFSSLGLRVDGSHNMSLMAWVAEKARNDLLWNGKQKPPREIIFSAEEWLAAYRSWHQPRKAATVRTPLKWSKPSEGWVKSNFDGAWHEASRRGGVGVVCCNSNGEFLGALSGGWDAVSSPLHAELVAARRAVLFIQDHFVDRCRIIFEGDSSLTLATMKNHGDDTSFLGSLINDIKTFIKDISQKNFNLIRREANNVAHRLARAVIGCQQEVMCFEETPNFIADVLFEDASIVNHMIILLHGVEFWAQLEQTVEVLLESL
ncbi:uncharacterized protein [Pyrus communis]|uniref:uncharacterized protein n=1 Tax=Pyrus communis TaxID=23211 RepID=UPI0035C08E6C